MQPPAYPPMLLAQLLILLLNLKLTTGWSIIYLFHTKMSLIPSVS